MKKCILILVILASLLVSGIATASVAYLGGFRDADGLSLVDRVTAGLAALGSGGRCDAVWRFMR